MSTPIYINEKPRPKRSWLQRHHVYDFGDALEMFGEAAGKIASVGIALAGVVCVVLIMCGWGT